MCVCVSVKEGRRGQGREEERRERERRRERRGFHFIRGSLSCIVNVNFEGRWPVTHLVKSSRLIVVDFQSWNLSFIIAGISFRSTSRISAPTF